MDTGDLITCSNSSMLVENRMVDGGGGGNLTGETVRFDVSDVVLLGAVVGVEGDTVDVVLVGAVTRSITDANGANDGGLSTRPSCVAKA